MVNLVEIVEESYIYENRPIFGTKLQLIPGNKWISGTSLQNNFIYIKTSPDCSRNTIPRRNLIVNTKFVEGVNQSMLV